MAEPTPTITLENVAMAPRGPVVFHLDHEIYCAAAGDCRCVRAPGTREDYLPEKAKRVTSAENKRFPEAISLMAKGTAGAKSRSLHPDAAKCPEVAALLAQRKVRVCKDVAVAEPLPEAPLPAEQASPAAEAPKLRPRKSDASPAAPPT